MENYSSQKNIVFYKSKASSYYQLNVLPVRHKSY